MFRFLIALCLSERTFEFGENLFDRVEIRAVWRQEEYSGTNWPDCFFHGTAFMRTESDEKRCRTGIIKGALKNPANRPGSKISS